MQNSFKKFEEKIQNIVENNSDNLFSSNQKLSATLSLVKEAFLSIGHIDERGKLVTPSSISVAVSEGSPFLLNEELVDQLILGVQVLTETFNFDSDSQIPLKITTLNENKSSDIIVNLLFDDKSSQATWPSSSMAVVNPIPAGAFFIVNGKEIFPLQRNIINIGRYRKNHIVIEDPKVSRRHGQLRGYENTFQYIDLNSTGGSKLNGETISKAFLLPGDVLNLAGSMLIYGQDAAVDLMETQEIDVRGLKNKSDPNSPKRK